MAGILLIGGGDREFPDSLVRDQADQCQHRRINLCGGCLGRETMGGIACHGMTMTGHKKTG
jgi:hypothetical protein